MHNCVPTCVFSPGCSFNAHAPRMYDTGHAILLNHAASPDAPASTSICGTSEVHRSSGGAVFWRVGYECFTVTRSPESHSKGNCSFAGSTRSHESNGSTKYGYGALPPPAFEEPVDSCIMMVVLLVVEYLHTLLGDFERFANALSRLV